MNAGDDLSNSRETSKQLQIIQSGEQCQFICNICKNVFSSKRHLKQHSGTCLRESVCNESLSSTEKGRSENSYMKYNSQIRNPRSTFHSDAVKQTESTCTASTTTSTVYYKCRQCNRLFVSLTSVQQHRLTVHAARCHLFGCGLCEKTYSIEEYANICFYNHELIAAV